MYWSASNAEKDLKNPFWECLQKGFEGGLKGRELRRGFEDGALKGLLGGWVHVSPPGGRFEGRERASRLKKGGLRREEGTRDVVPGGRRRRGRRSKVGGGLLSTFPSEASPFRSTPSLRSPPPSTARELQTCTFQARRFKHHQNSTKRHPKRGKKE